MNPDPAPFEAEITQLEERIAIQSEPRLNVFTEETEDRYKLTVPDVGVVIEVNRLRRESHELIGELCVRCRLPGRGRMTVPCQSPISTSVVPVPDQNAPGCWQRDPTRRDWIGQDSLRSFVNASWPRSAKVNRLWTSGPWRDPTTTQSRLKV